MYDVTAINGLIDGISLTPFSDDSSAWRDEIALGLKKTPVLAIPETRFAEGLQPSSLSSVAGCQLDE